MPATPRPRGTPMRAFYSGTSLLTALLCLTTLTAAAPAAEPAQRALWIVQAGSVAAARRNVAAVGGRVDRELEIINGVSVYLDPGPIERLRARAGVHLYEDRAVSPRA